MTRIKKLEMSLIKDTLVNKKTKTLVEEIQLMQCEANEPHYYKILERLVLMGKEAQKIIDIHDKCCE